MTITHLHDYQSKSGGASMNVRDLKNNLMPEHLFETGSLGVNDYHEQWGDYLLQMACGVAHPKEGGGVVLKDGERAAAAWASIVIVHDDPALESMGPEGLTDGHVVMVPVSALKRRAGNPRAASAWIGEGAYMCARVALGEENVQADDWAVVSREQLRAVIAHHPKAEQLLEVIANAPEQDAWRYATAMLAYAGRADGELTNLAKHIQEAELDKGWGNQEWQPFLALEGEKWQWRKNGALRKGIQSATLQNTDLILSLRTTQQKFRMTNLLLAQMAGGCSMEDRIEFARGVTSHHMSTESDRMTAINVASYHSPMRSTSAFNAIVENGWLQHSETLAECITAQHWWMQAMEADNEALYLPAMAVLVHDLHAFDETPGGGKADEEYSNPYTVDGPIEIDEIRQMIGWMRTQLSQTHDLPAEAVHDLAKNLPNTACQWILENPQHAGARDNRTGENFDVIEALTQHFEEWVERDGHALVARQVASVISMMPRGHVFDVDTVGWLCLQEAAGESKAFRCVYEAASKIEPGFANKALMSLAMDPESTPAMVEYMVALGGDPLAKMDIQYLNGDAIPERILDVGRRHESLAVRTAFRRMAQQQPADKQDNIITLKSPRTPK